MKMAGWYKVRRSTVIRMGGGDMLQRCNSSLYETLCEIYPFFPWQRCKFLEEAKSRCTAHFHLNSEDQENILNTLNKLKEEIGIKNVSVVVAAVSHI